MEPCLFRHGKALAAIYGTDYGSELQWSHVFSDMVRGKLAKAAKIAECFNGAMSFQTW